MVRIANVHAHGQAQQLAHKVIFQAGTNDLPLVGEILRPNEPNHAVDQEWLEDARHAVGASFQRELINSVVGLGG